MFSVARIRFFCNIAAGNDFFDWQVKFFRKLIIALIMRWHGHNRTRTVAHQHIIGNPNRQFLASDWMNRVCTGEYSCFFFRQIRTLKVAFAFNCI